MPPYSRDWAEAAGEETLAEAARAHLVEIAPAAFAPGDVLLFRYAPHHPAKHAAVATAPTRMVHAHDGAAVAEVAIVPWWRRRLVYAFRFPGVADCRAFRSRAQPRPGMTEFEFLFTQTVSDPWLHFFSPSRVPRPAARCSGRSARSPGGLPARLPATSSTRRCSGGGRDRQVQGPRLPDLDVMASTEGAPIPRVYGRVRVAGEVIWATQLEEAVSTRTEETGGKGGASGGEVTTTTYRYFGNFAVGLCEGPIGIGRARLGRRQAARSQPHHHAGLSRFAKTRSPIR